MALCCHKRDLTAHNNNIHLYGGILYLVKHDVGVIIYGNNLLFIMWKVRHTENETHNLTRKTRCFFNIIFCQQFSFIQDGRLSGSRLQPDVGASDVQDRQEPVVQRLPQRGAQQSKLDQEALEHVQDLGKG